MGHLLVIVLVLVVLGISVALAADIAFDRRMTHEIEALLADARTAGRRIITNDDAERLPVSVQRWLRRSNVFGTSVATSVRLRQHGQVRLESAGWMPFEAEQYFTISPPGLLWKARFRMAPFVSVVGRDQYRRRGEHKDAPSLPGAGGQQGRRRPQPMGSPAVPQRDAVVLLQRSAEGRLPGHVWLTARR